MQRTSQTIYLIRQVLFVYIHIYIIKYMFYDCGFVFGQINCRYLMSWKNKCLSVNSHSQMEKHYSRFLAYPRSKWGHRRWVYKGRCHVLAIATLWKGDSNFPLSFLVSVHHFSVTGIMYIYIYMFLSFFFSHFSSPPTFSGEATGVRGDIRRNARRVISGYKRAASYTRKQGENSSSLFMSFLFDLLSSWNISYYSNEIQIKGETREIRKMNFCHCNSNF